MSASITAYAVDLNALRRAVGGADPDLESRMRDAELPSMDRRRAQDLVYLGGQSMPWSDGGYALEALCRVLGRELPGASMGRLGYDAAPRLSEADELLDDLGVSLSWSQLYLLSGPPVPLSADPGWPRVFHLVAGGVRAAAAAVRAAMAPDRGAAHVQRLLARARRERAPRETINGLQRWLAAWPVFGSVRQTAALRALNERRLAWAKLTPSFDLLDGLNWRAAALLEETAGWLGDAASGELGLVGFEY